MYLNTQTLQQCTERDIRALLPGVSHPDPFQPPEGYAVLFAAPKPAHDPITQAVREATPVLTSKGHWEQRWEVVALDADTITANQAAAAAQIIASFDAALTAHLDATARARRWDNRINLMARAGFPGPFQAEAIAFGTWADTCNATAYQLMLDVQAGEQPMPASVDAFLSALPPMVWPT